MLVIIDYKMGNIRSLRSALAFLGCDATVSDEPAVILKADKLILPGVGAFDAAMRKLRQLNLVDTINEAVLTQRKPVLGICLGMQILASRGEENGPTDGLGWIKGVVRHMSSVVGAVRIPHVGFNSVRFVGDSQDWSVGLDAERDFYFVHSYQMECEDESDVAGWVDYGGHDLVAMVRRDNIFGAQFHPEKSQSNGLTLLRNFVLL